MSGATPMARMTIEHGGIIGPGEHKCRFRIACFGRPLKHQASADEITGSGKFLTSFQPQRYLMLADRAGRRRSNSRWVAKCHISRLAGGRGRHCGLSRPNRRQSAVDRSRMQVHPRLRAWPKLTELWIVRPACNVALVT